jgi:DNA invertase Pin-like site-specific DNA recombinase
LPQQLASGGAFGAVAYLVRRRGSFAEFEREIMLERQREGVAKAKADGKYKGRVPTAQRKGAEVVQLRGQGVKPEEIAAKLGISRASVFRVLKDRREATQS